MAFPDSLPPTSIAKLPKNKMFVSDAGAAAIVAKSHLVFDLVYDHTANPSAQVDAISHLARYNVHHDPDGPCPTGHWSIAWSNHKDRSSPPAIWSIKYILMVCTCGYDHTKRNSKNRTAAFPLTDCPAHLEITVHPPTGAILRVRGLAEHNAACDSAMLEHRPHQPVAAIVYRTALEQLSSGAQMRAIFRKNVELIRIGRGKHGYPGFPVDRVKDPYRWLLDQRKETRSILRQFQRLKGVKLRERAEYNIDDWLDPDSQHYKPVLASAIFHYSARKAKDERLEVCISTPEMEEAAWRYGHEGQLLLDGTFGVTNSPLLPFIVMVVDEANKGIPVAFLLFSAPTGNQQSSAGSLTPRLAVPVLPRHIVYSANGNHRYRHEGTRGPAGCFCGHLALDLSLPPQALVIDLRDRLRHFEQLLLQQPNETAARAFIARERATLETALKAANGGSLPDIAINVFKHLDYLGDGFWLRLAFSTAGLMLVESRRHGLQWCVEELALAGLEAWRSPSPSRRLRERPRYQSRGRLTALTVATTPTAALADDIRDAWKSVLVDGDEATSESGDENAASEGSEDVETTTELLTPLILPPLDAAPLMSADSTSIQSASQTSTPSAADAFEAQAHSRFFFEINKVKHVLDCCLDAFKSLQNPAAFTEQQMATISGLERHVHEASNSNYTAL
ncbi:SWIM-type domain-containing protein [Mycena indigotica]|uniref:SWIM-type domain-containing protein n=1 Tax=Mycena indigotica TaxID=2126181 RepID=A0A8H6S5F5_9AGAR|nr:SWIM-type domain-containing protein [Mycena indigotica]KAF7293435.1 SWIM-type domain-containing protein [Mycena indigotica]